MTPEGLSPAAWQNFQELLPWYVNGTLGREDRAALDTLLARHAECRSQLAELVAMAAAVRQERVEVDEYAGLARLISLVIADSSSANVRAIPSERVIPPPPARRRFRPIWAGVAAALLIQVGALVFLNQQSVDDASLALQGAAPTMPARVTLQVTIRRGAPEAGVGSLLDRLPVRKLSGPGALGIYTLTVSAGDSSAVIRQLSLETELVESVTVVTN